MKTVNDILRTKGNVVWSVSPNTTVLEALKLMAEKDIGAVMVIDMGKLVGIFSERDYARRVVLEGKASKDTSVEQVMSRKVLFISPEQTTDHCMMLMTDKRVRHLPVLTENEKLLGVISIGDVVKAIISEQEYVIEQLERYITGTGYGM